MRFHAVLMLYVTVWQVNCIPQLPPVSHTVFPKGFFFGVGSSAYQYEGAWNKDGKGPSIWDHMAHTNPGFFANGVNGDVATDSYYKYKEDIALVKEIGFQVYRISISWPRILPNGTTDYVNQAGVDYYVNVIDELLAKGITPLVTLYHYDLPQALEDIGGWLNADVIDHYVDYADLIFKLFGNKVKHWITINEGYYVAIGYGSNIVAPALSSLHGVGEYKVAHNLLLAHGRIYRLYQKKYKSEQGGKLSMTIAGWNCLPLTNSHEDIAAAERCFTFSFDWFGHPIYEGDYNPEMRAVVDGNSKAEGRDVSRLPYFTDEEVEMIKGTSDFFGLNTYTLFVATPGAVGDNPSITRDMAVNFTEPPSWQSNIPSFTASPQSIRIIVNKVRERYGNIDIIVSENGYADYGAQGINDDGRVKFYEGFLGELRQAIYEDGCNVLGYLTWSLLDAVEWASGTSIEFGLVDVDYGSPNRTRKMKKSGYWMKNYLALQKIYSSES